MEPIEIGVTIFHVSAADGQWVIISLKDWSALVDMIKTLPTVNVAEVDLTQNKSAS